MDSFMVNGSSVFQIKFGGEKYNNMLFITLLLIMAIPLSLLTIQINTGFGSGANWVDAVKMGYPIFWTTILLGITGLIIAKQPDFIITGKN